MTAERPVIALTMGDAAGVGPEVIVKALQSRHIYGVARPLVVGSSAIMQDAIDLVKSPVRLHSITDTTDITGEYGTIDLVDLQNIDREDFVTGKVCPVCGKAAMENIDEAVRLVLSGQARALVTAPINKEATKQAGYGEVGHLEYLASLTNAKEYATMLVSGRLRVVHLTTHYSLKDACGLVTRDNILARLRLTHDSFLDWGISKPRIAVAALNPHGGESGLFGSEEIEEITPAVEEARSLSIDARGPFPADSVFNRAIAGEFDVVLAMYHDQGHIPVKVHGFEKSISIALGLPFVRTSVDHGTAFDIAGKGVADSQSMEEAIAVAAGLVSEGRLTAA